MTADRQLFHYPCPQCGLETSRVRVFVMGREFAPDARPVCPACLAKHQAAEDARKAAEAWAARVRRLPRDYAAAVESKVPEALRPVLGWTASPHYGGVGLVGPPGEGKSSAVACLVLRLRRTFIWWSGTEARDAANAFARADKGADAVEAERWREAMTVPVLVLDDISQGNFTAAWASRLFDLLETRLSKQRPTFWTSQKSLQTLQAKIVHGSADPDQAAAICRRLGQHSLYIDVTPRLQPALPNAERMLL